MRPNPLTNFEIQKYYQNNREFNGVYSRINLPKIKDGVFHRNSWGTHWVALYVNGDNWSTSYDITCFDSFEVEYIPK